MANPYNNILSGLYQGGTSLAAGLIDKADRDKVKEKTAYLTDLFKKSMDGAHDIVNPIAKGEFDFYGKSPADRTSDVQTQTPDLNKLYEGITELGTMRYGGPYANMLSNMINNTQPEYDIMEGKDGDIYAIDKKTLKTKQLTKAPEKEKEFSTKNWEIFKDDQGNPYWGERTNKDGKIQIEFRDKLNQEELDNYNYDKQKEVKSLSTGTGRGRYRGTGKGTPVDNYSQLDKNVVDDLMKFANLKYESVAGGEDYWYSNDKYGDKVESDKGKAYKELKKKLELMLPGQDVDQLALEVQSGDYKKKTKIQDATKYVESKKQSAQYVSDLRSFQKDIEENVYAYEQDGKRVPNYQIAPEYWVKELKESGFLDFESEGEWNELASWFKEKTGRDITAYINKPKF